MSKRILFHVEHLSLMEMVPEYKESLLGLDNVRYVLSKITGGPSSDAVTIVEDGRVLMCMGYYAISPGVAEVWLFPSIYVKEYPVEVVRTVRQYLDALAETFKWHRIQTVTMDNEQHRKWMSVLGFVEEGRLIKYFQKQDYFMSARYFEVEE